jgi:hypothetical protein
LKQQPGLLRRWGSSRNTYGASRRAIICCEGVLVAAGRESQKAVLRIVSRP